VYTRLYPSPSDGSGNGFGAASLWSRGEVLGTVIAFLSRPTKKGGVRLVPSRNRAGSSMPCARIQAGHGLKCLASATP